MLCRQFPELERIVQIGAGDRPVRPTSRPTVMVDMRPGPPGIDSLISFWDVDRARWEPELHAWATGPVLLTMIEFLDDLPCPISDGSHHLNTSGTCSHRLTAEEREWVARWWPGMVTGEVGTTRDAAWRWFAENLPEGSLMLAVDYGHVSSRRPSGSTLTAHRDGHEVSPADPAGNLTAHVAIDSLAAAAECAGASTLECLQLKELTLSEPPFGGLSALAYRSQLALWRDPRRFGDFWWLLQRVGDNDGRV